MRPAEAEGPPRPMRSSPRRTGGIHMAGRAGTPRRFFTLRSGRARRAAVAITAIVGTVTAGVVGMSLAASAAGTNGDSITWAQTACIATVQSQPLVQNIDIAVQAVVPNTVAQGASYSDTIPGGTTTLPNNSNGFTITGYKNLNQTYLFRSSSGFPTITSATANGDAVNNGSSVPYNVTTTNAGTTDAITAGSWSINNGGQLSYTANNTLNPGQLVHVTGAHNTGYNLSGAEVATASSTGFTVNGNTLKISAATYSSANGGTLTFTTTTAHGLVVGQSVATSGSTPPRYNQATATTVVASVPSSTQFTITGVGTTDPGPIVTKGTVATLGNPGTIGTPKGSVSTLTTVTLSTPNAAPGTLTVPDVTLNMTAPVADATVTSYGALVTTTATLQGLGDAATVCNLPHVVPQTDGISATLVGAGG